MLVIYKYLNFMTSKFSVEEYTKFPIYIKLRSISKLIALTTRMIDTIIITPGLSQNSSVLGLLVKIMISLGVLDNHFV